MAVFGAVFSTLRSAHHLFDKITHRIIFLQTPLCSLYYGTLCSHQIYLEDPVDIYGRNKDVFTWTSDISGLVKQNRPKEAIDMFKLMLMNKRRPNYVTVMSLLRATNALRLKCMTFGVHGLIIKMGFELEVSIVTALIGAYANYDMAVTRKLFYDVPFKDLVMWSAMISMCVKNGEYMEAIELFRKMLYEGIEPNFVSIVSVLPACAKLGALPYGKQVHGFAIKMTFYSENNVQNSLIDMYAKCGDLNYSERVFARAQRKDLVTWKIMIHGCIENDCPGKALLVFTQMQLSCFELEDVILCDVIGAASDAENLIFGLGLHGCSFKSGSVGSISVGTSLVQMYAKFGLAKQARLLFDQIHPKDLIAWTAMISSYV